MDIFIKTSKRTIQLPVLPSSFLVSGGMNNTEVNINSIGSVNLLGKRGLVSVPIASFFPAQQYSFCRCVADSPYSYCEELERAKNENDICVLNVTGTTISLHVTIESFEYGEEDGSGDVFYTLNLKEYRTISTARVKKKTKTKKYKVKKGDTWYSIARKVTGLSANAQKIAKKNKSKVTKKPKVGKKVKVDVTS